MDRFQASVIGRFLEKKDNSFNQQCKSVLHVGCGTDYIKDLKGFEQSGWVETRLDINEVVNPDIISTLTDLSKVRSGSVDVVYSSHSVEHIFAHEVPLALKEFNRVLNLDGFAIIFCPDMEFVCEKVANGGLTEVIYESPAGPITALDVIYGYGRGVMDGNHHMAHKTGFTIKTLSAALKNAGFSCTIGNNPQPWNIGIVAFKKQIEIHQMKLISTRFI